MMYGMYEYIVERFAGLLTKGDVMELFKLLERRYATIAKVCERVGIERKTFYNWRAAKEISSDTKAKVLRAALEEYMLDVLEFLASKSRERCVEALSIAMEHLRHELLAEENPQRLRELVKATERLLNNFSTPITDFLTQEMSALMETATWKGQQITLAKSQMLYPREIIEALGVISKGVYTSTKTYAYITASHPTPPPETPPPATLSPPLKEGIKLRKEGIELRAGSL